MSLAYIPASPGNGFNIGPLFIHAYGLAYVVAVIAAIAITVKRWEAHGGSRELVYEIAMWGFPAGLIGGRIYFDVTTPARMPQHWWGPFAIWDGGLGIWGGIALAAVVSIWRLRRRGVNAALFMDAVAPALLVAQGIGRLGNYFNQELFGLPTKLPWALEVTAAHRPPGYGAYTTFNPTFLYELIWDMLLAYGLVQLGKRTKVKAPGLFALYVAGYSFARLGEEQLRIDYSLHVLGMRLNFFVALTLCLGALVWFVGIQRGWSWVRPRGVDPEQAVLEGGAVAKTEQAALAGRSTAHSVRS